MMKRRITFDTPTEVLSFVRACLDDLDVDRLYGAAQEATSEFWRERIFDDLREIEESETLLVPMQPMIGVLRKSRPKKAGWFVSRVRGT